MTDRKQENRIRLRKIISLTLLALILVLFILIAYFVGKPLVREFRESPETFRAYVSGHGFLGDLLMIGLIVLQVVVAFIPGEPFELGAGFVFGWFRGTVLCLAGAAIASCMIYGAVKKWGNGVIRLFFPQEKIDHFANLLSKKKRELLVFILFLIPGTPKDLLVYVVGLTPMRLRTFLWISTLARIPSVVSSAVTGSLVHGNRFLAANITYGVTLLISAVCIYWYRRLSKLEKQEKNQ